MSERFDSSSPDSLSRGCFVVVVGPDGAGKTTVARALIEQFDGPTAYFHFRPPFRQGMIATPPMVSIPPISKGSRHGSVPMGWVRLAVNFVRFWAGYLRRVRPALRKGALVVGDRWAYGYLAQPYALKFYGPAWLARLGISAMPKPDAVVNLVAPPEVIHTRKQELDVEEIRDELSMWIALPIENLVNIRADGQPDHVAEAIEREVPALRAGKSQA